jgi:origin recognition complex subunit 3
VRTLLENDEFLFRHSLEYLKTGQQRMRDIFQAVKAIHLCLKSLNNFKNSTIPDLSIRALSGELQDSTFMNDLLGGLKTLNSFKLKEFFAITPRTWTDRPEYRKIREDLEVLMQTYQGSEPLRSEYDNHNSVVSTTVVQQRVRLNKSKAKLSQENQEYTKIIDRIHALSERYFVETLVKPQDLFLHEAFLFDMKNPLKETFSPRPRFAIERALSNPFDYLISSSERAEARISAQQPATAILYQLYLESGAIVNVYDLWQAFYAVFESEQGDVCDERMIMALFYRAASELKALGMLKSSRKKVDHAAKSAWIGL